MAIPRTFKHQESVLSARGFFKFHSPVETSFAGTCMVISRLGIDDARVSNFEGVAGFGIQDAVAVSVLLIFPLLG